MNKPCRGDGKTEESIITSDGKRLVKVPIRTLEEYRFRFDANQGKRVGQGDGDSKVGDVIARGRAGKGPGTGQQPGSDPGVDYYEAEVTVDDLAALIFEDLGLPDLKPKSTQEMQAESVRFTEVRKKGPMANLDRKRTIMENLKRNARQGVPAIGNITNDDLRFKVWEQELRPSSSAVVLAMRDASGSMGEFKKYITRSLFFWINAPLGRTLSSKECVDKPPEGLVNYEMETGYLDNGKPVESRGRKATGLRTIRSMIAEPPKEADLPFMGPITPLRRGGRPFLSGFQPLSGEVLNKDKPKNK